MHRIFIVLIISIYCNNIFSQIDKTFLEADASQIKVLSTKPLEPILNPEFSPDGEKLVFRKITNVFQVLELATLQPLLAFTGSGTGGWSPNSEQLAYYSDSKIIIFDFKSRKHKTLHKVSEGQFWFWINNEEIMFKLAGGAYSLNINDLSSRNYNIDKASLFEKSIPNPSLRHPNIKLSQEKNNSSTLMVANIDDSYIRPILGDVEYFDKVIPSPGNKYAILHKRRGQKSDNYSLITLGLREKPTLKYSFDIDILTKLNEPERALYLKSIKEGLLITGSISGIKLNPYTKEPIGAGGAKKADFKILVANEKEASIVITHEYGAIEEGDVINQLVFYRRYTSTNYQNPKGPSHIRYDFELATQSSFWLPLQAYREVASSVNVQSNNVQPAAKPVDSELSNSKIMNKEYAGASVCGSLPIIGSAYVKVNPLEVSCNSCNQQRTEVASIKKAIEDQVTVSPRWENSIPSEIKAQYMLDFSLAELNYATRTSENGTGYMVQLKLRWGIKASGKQIKRGILDIGYGPIMKYQGSKEDAWNQAINSLSGRLDRMVYGLFPIAASIEGVKDKTKKGVVKSFYVTADYSFPSGTKMQFLIGEKLKINYNSGLPVLTESIGKCTLVKEGSKLICNIGKGGKDIQKKLDDKAILILLSNQIW